MCTDVFVMDYSLSAILYERIWKMDLEFYADFSAVGHYSAQTCLKSMSARKNKVPKQIKFQLDLPTRGDLMGGEPGGGTLIAPENIKRELPDDLPPSSGPRSLGSMQKVPSLSDLSEESSLAKMMSMSQLPEKESSAFDGTGKIASVFWLETAAGMTCVRTSQTVARLQAERKKEKKGKEPAVSAYANRIRYLVRIVGVPLSRHQLARTRSTYPLLHASERADDSSIDIVDSAQVEGALNLISIAVVSAIMRTRALCAVYRRPFLVCRLLNSYVSSHGRCSGSVCSFLSADAAGLSEPQCVTKKTSPPRRNDE
ncbi:hypothetical protein HPB49_023414 [Dermacentor silvarum]|uniref:Uncharacterized protein n=1 Tax=Dermacentor silvarum TaxID=543639 RepID=A0ACB8CN51_DERSI|nr:hypothetical protein HPB49_023414 [Dermacentor silvarum]